MGENSGTWVNIPILGGFFFIPTKVPYPFGFDPQPNPPKTEDDLQAALCAIDRPRPIRTHGNSFAVAKLEHRRDINGHDLFAKKWKIRCDPKSISNHITIITLYYLKTSILCLCFERFDSSFTLLCLSAFPIAPAKPRPEKRRGDRRKRRPRSQGSEPRS